MGPCTIARALVSDARARTLPHHGGGIASLVQMSFLNKVLVASGLIYVATRVGRRLVQRARAAELDEVFPIVETEVVIVAIEPSTMDATMDELVQRDKTGF